MMTERDFLEQMIAASGRCFISDEGCDWCPIDESSCNPGSALMRATRRLKEMNEEDKTLGFLEQTILCGGKCPSITGHGRDCEACHMSLDVQSRGCQYDEVLKDAIKKKQKITQKRQRDFLKQLIKQRGNCGHPLYLNRFLCPLNGTFTNCDTCSSPSERELRAKLMLGRHPDSNFPTNGTLIDKNMTPLEEIEEGARCPVCKQLYGDFKESPYCYCEGR